MRVLRAGWGVLLAGVALLQGLDEDRPPPDWYRTVRAVEVLERVATPAARAILKELAKGDARSHLTREAATTLARLQKGTLAAR